MCVEYQCKDAQGGKRTGSSYLSSPQLDLLYLGVFQDLTLFLSKIILFV